MCTGININTKVKGTAKEAVIHAAVGHNAQQRDHRDTAQLVQCDNLIRLAQPALAETLSG